MWVIHRQIKRQSVQQPSFHVQHLFPAFLELLVTTKKQSAWLHSAGCEASAETSPLLSNGFDALLRTKW